MGDSRASRSIRRRRGDTASRSPPAGSPPAARDCGGPGAREFAAAVRAPVVGEAPSPASIKDSDAVVTSNASRKEVRSVGWLATPSEGGRPRNRDDLAGLRDTERTDRRFLIPGHPHLAGPSSRGTLIPGSCTRRPRRSSAGTTVAPRVKARRSTFRLAASASRRQRALLPEGRRGGVLERGTLPPAQRRRVIVQARRRSSRRPHPDAFGSNPIAACRAAVPPRGIVIVLHRSGPTRIRATSVI